MKHMTRSIVVSSAAACICLGLATPLFAAEPAAGGAANPPSTAGKTAAAQPAEQCLTDLRAFDSQMQKDGYWRSGSGSGYGYPMMGGYGFGNYPMNGGVAATRTGYRDVRPGYDVRTLIAAANILARNGQQQACEDVLATTRSSYKLYVADVKSGKGPTANEPGWQQRQVAAATPVTAKNDSFRSDQLIGTEVRNPQSEALGSVDDIVMSPQTGKIAYLVIARGGLFGIDENYVPVPWGDFKVTPNASLLVLDTSRSAMAAGPRVSHDQFATPGQFDQQSQKVDDYWKTHLSNNGTGKTNG
jgi:sporulation protein YlmC with PRC-barrel domain